MVYGRKKEQTRAQDLIKVFMICKGLNMVRPNDVFYVDGSKKDTKSYSLKLVKVRFLPDIRKYFYTNRVINRWNQLDQTIDGTSINA